MPPRKKISRPLCAVEGCEEPAIVEVFLEDIIGFRETFHFFEQDESCPFLCREHLKQNEEESTGWGRSRSYPFSKHGFHSGVEGWSVYRTLTRNKTSEN